MGFLEQIQMKSVTLKVEGLHEVFFGGFSLFYGVSNMCIHFSSLSKPIFSSCAQPSPCPKGEKPHPKCASYVKDSPKFGSYIGQLMGPPPKTSKGQPNKKSYMLEM